MSTKIKLIYFDAMALGEPVRYMLHHGRVDFEETRLTYEQWATLKNTTPFGKLPVLEIDGTTVHQSAAICRYLGKQQGLAGADGLEALHIDAIADTCADIRLIIVDYGFRTEESQKPKKKETLLNETLPFYFSRLEKIAKDNKGYFVNGKLSYADIYFVALLELFNSVMGKDLTSGYPTLKSLAQKVNALPGIKEWVARRPKTAY